MRVGEKNKRFLFSLLSSWKENTSPFYSAVYTSVYCSEVSNESLWLIFEFVDSNDRKTINKKNSFTQNFNMLKFIIEGIVKSNSDIIIEIEDHLLWSRIDENSKMFDNALLYYS